MIVQTENKLDHAVYSASIVKTERTLKAEYEAGGNELAERMAQLMGSFVCRIRQEAVIWVGAMRLSNFIRKPVMVICLDDDQRRLSEGEFKQTIALLLEVCDLTQFVRGVFDEIPLSAKFSLLRTSRIHLPSFSKIPVFILVSRDENRKFSLDGSIQKTPDDADIEMGAEHSAIADVDASDSGNQEDLVIELIEAGAFKEVLDVLDRRLKTQPDDWWSLYMSGIAHRALGDFEAAISCLAKARNLSPQQAPVLLAYGIANQMAGRFDDAIEAFESAIQMKPDLTEAYISLGLTYRKMGSNKSALESYGRGMRLLVAEVSAEVLGVSLADYAREHATTTLPPSEHQRVAELFRRDLRFSILHNNMGICKANLGDIAGAKDDFELAIAAIPEDKTYLDPSNNLQMLTVNKRSAIHQGGTPRFEMLHNLYNRLRYSDTMESAGWAVKQWLKVFDEERWPRVAELVGICCLQAFVLLPALNGTLELRPKSEWVYIVAGIVVGVLGYGLNYPREAVTGMLKLPLHQYVRTRAVALIVAWWMPVYFLLINWRFTWVLLMIWAVCYRIFKWPPLPWW